MMYLKYVPNNFSKSVRKALGYFVVVAVLVQTSGSYSLVSRFVRPARAVDQYLMYAVEDSGGSTSQFFTLKPDQGTASVLGPQYPQYDIEGIDIHPSTGALYAVAGGGGDQDGKLFLVDK